MLRQTCTLPREVRPGAWRARCLQSSAGAPRCRGRGLAGAPGSAAGRAQRRRGRARVGPSGGRDGRGSEHRVPATPGRARGRRLGMKRSTEGLSEAWGRTSDRPSSRVTAGESCRTPSDHLHDTRRRGARSGGRGGLPSDRRPAPLPRRRLPRRSRNSRRSQLTAWHAPRRGARARGTRVGV